ncbi:cysteine hydrolase family protein [Amycolatopsis sp. FBCC-B4732]|uniref:cysteine hydrolase family protein n=1 Tax=Amycolatopsis sp. FBCC-B4732 TaxID=3079339 RepID=UPI0037BF8CE3
MPPLDPDRTALHRRHRRRPRARRARRLGAHLVRRRRIRRHPGTSVFAATADHRAAMHADAPATQIDARLVPEDEDVRVRKIRVGAFTTTGLEARLRARGITTLVLAGISTSGVVLSTVREAMDRDYRVVVLRDACADREAATHDFLTGTLFPRTCSVVDVAGLGDLWADR